MKTRVLLLCLLVLCLSGSAFAIVGKVTRKTDDDKDVAVPAPTPIFSCTPGNFALTKENDGLHFHGQVQVPTGGWAYQLDEEEPGPDGSLHATLHMQSPGDMATQVISQVDIDHTFSGESDRLTVDVDGLKDNYKIECKMAGTTK